MRAPLAAVPLTTATELLFFKLTSDFCLLTTICEPPKTLEAGRFSAAMMDVGVLCTEGCRKDRSLAKFDVECTLHLSSGQADFSR